MKIPLYQIDAFAERPFEGNPAAVCPLESWLPDRLLQLIAEENNLSETAFYVRAGENYELRWFTPVKEVDLCGHATLAAAHVILKSIESEQSTLLLQSRSGPLKVSKAGELLTLDFPQQPGVRCETPPQLEEALGAEPLECFRSTDYMAVFRSEKEIVDLTPDFALLRSLELRGVIVTAPSRKFDFVSRFFAPKFGIDEDPVTGSAHCTLAPYWTARLAKKETTARQLSRRKGTLWCKVEGNRVLISGRTIAYLEGHIEIA